MGFFETAVRRSKRGCRGKLHRCNGGMEKDRVLSRDLDTLNYKDLGSGGTAAMTLSQSISHVCFHHIAMDSCGRGRFQCADGWFDYDIIRSADDYCSGFVSGHTKSEAYQFYRTRGADPVIKKLGNDSPNIITVNILKGNGRKSLEGMSSVVLTKQENGQYAVTSAPTSFGIRDGNGTVDWGYNMGGASITQE